MLGIQYGSKIAELSPGTSVWTCDSIEFMGSEWKNEMGGFLWGP